MVNTIKMSTIKMSTVKFVLALVMMCGVINSSAQINEVTLTVSGDGKTKDEATAIALRSAIEQAFGTFVSANTTILDDKLVKDEIATVSSGNIQDYEEIATVLLPTGNTSVTLQATVSVSKLVSYAQSKGSSAEFAGATFGANMKLKELNKKNEEKAIANMVVQLKALAPTMFDYKLVLGEPRLPSKGYNDYNNNDDDDNLGEKSEDYYVIDAQVQVCDNEITKMSNSILLKTLSSLSLTKSEREEYEKLNIPYYGLVIKAELNSNIDARMWKEEFDSVYYLRSENYSIYLSQIICCDIRTAIYGFKITDNLQNISKIEPIYGYWDGNGDVKAMPLQRNGNELIYGYWDGNGKVVSRKKNQKEDYIYYGLISYARNQNLGYIYFQPFDYYVSYPHILDTSSSEMLRQNGCYIVKFLFAIPKADISKYTNFTISRK